MIFHIHASHNTIESYFFLSFSSRPPLHHLVVPEQIERVVILAWNKTPQDRPSFSQIVDSLKEVAGAEGPGQRFTLRRDSDLNDSQPQEAASTLLPLYSSRMSNDELKKKVNTHGYVLPENSYQYRYSVCPNTHLNNSSPKPFTKAAASPKPVKKVEFETEEKGQNLKKEKRKGRGGNVSPKVFLKVESDNCYDMEADSLCVEKEPGTTDL